MIECSAIGPVLDHLLFHKAIIDEGERAKKIDGYLDILHQSKDGVPMASVNPLDQSIQLVFELVLSNNFDPWDIDLVEFARLYAQKMNDEEVNFIIAGKLIFMAWSILRLQSEKVLFDHEKIEGEGLFCSDWDIDSLDAFRQEPLVLAEFCEVPESVELTEVVRHRGSRPVSLVELLDAFDEARKDAEANVQRQLIREAMKKAQGVFDEKAHAEDLEKDVENVWIRIQRCGPGSIRIEDIYNCSKEDRVMVFVSLLFLAKMGRISIWQDDFPFGQIFLEVRVPWDIGTIEDATAAQIDVVKGEPAKTEMVI
jgi:segregation and condensation protein A